MKTFETFIRGGVKYLAGFNPDGSCFIINEKGDSFGTWRDGIASFEKFAESNGGFEAIKIGKARLSAIYERS